MCGKEIIESRAQGSNLVQTSVDHSVEDSGYQTHHPKYSEASPSRPQEKSSIPLLSYGPLESKQDPEVDAEDEEDLSSFKRIAQEVFDLSQIFEPSPPELKVTPEESGDAILEDPNPNIPQIDYHQAKYEQVYILANWNKQSSTTPKPFFSSPDSEVSERLDPSIE